MFINVDAAAPGWVSVACDSPEMTTWMREAIEQENVQARHEGRCLFLPAGEDFTLKGEIKNVITVVAKTTHYWQVHLSQDVKRALAIEARFSQMKRRLKRWFAKVKEISKRRHGKTKT